MKRIKQILGLILIGLFSMACSQSKWQEVKDENNKVVEKFMLNKEGLKDGPYEAYYSDGKIKQSAVYDNGVLNGERKIYYDNGNIEIEEIYVDDKLSGLYKNYDKNGQLILSASYVDGVMEGLLVKYDATGVKIEEVTMKNNEENGPFKEYYSNGQLHWEGQYLNGDNEFGELKEYDETGVLLKKMNCDSLAVCRTVWTKEDGVVVPKY